ncbi:PAS domain S-box protein [Chloroflexota bacterium]
MINTRNTETPVQYKSINKAALVELVIMTIGAVFVFMLAVVFDAFSMLVQWAQEFETWPIGELIIVIVLLAFTFAIFSFARWVELRKENTVRMQTEAALRESEKKLGLVFESVTEGIMVTDLRGNITQANDAATNMQDYANKEELIGNSIFDLVTEADRARAMQDFMKTLKVGHESTVEYAFESKNAKEFLAELSLAVLRDTDGNSTGFVVSTRDITERKRADIELRTQKELIDRIISSMPNAVFVLDEDMQVVLANQTLFNTLKMERSEVEDRHLGDVIPATELLQTGSKVLAGGETKSQLEFRHKVNGHDCMLVATIISMKEGEALVILADVTEERERQERLYLTDRLASVGEMASGIAHELNNPLTGVIGLAELLLESDIPDDIKEDVTSIYNEAKRSTKIVKNLLTFGRRHASVKEPHSIERIIEGVLQLRAYEHRVNNIQVNTQVEPELPDVMVDYFQMQQVFLNLILNAEFAMIEAHNRGTLDIAAERHDGKIRISFSDDGPGIAAENLGRLFDPFFTTKEVGKGTGLGLSICYGIVTGHDGTLYAQSDLGKGATFVVELTVNGH